MDQMTEAEFRAQVRALLPPHVAIVELWFDEEIPYWRRVRLAHVRDHAIETVYGRLDGDVEEQVLELLRRLAQTDAEHIAKFLAAPSGTTGAPSPAS